MSKYKVGDKVVMELTDKISVMEEPWYVLSNATSIYEPYLNEAAESLSTYIEQARAEGQNEAWELARKIVRQPINGGYKLSEFEEIFSCGYISDIFEKFTYSEAATKVEAWEKAKKEIKDDEDCLKCQFFEKHNDEYPCSHCCHCYTSKFKQIGR